MPLIKNGGMSGSTTIFLQVVIAYLAFLHFGSAWQSTSLLLKKTKWKAQLNIGLEPGTWMPKRFPGWAESGARLFLDVNIEFADEPCEIEEELVGLKEETGILRTCGGPSTFVSEFGEEKVYFETGGWCIERPTNNIKNENGDLVRPEGILRFWLDCTSGAKRRDVSLFPGTRIFFITGVWDDPTGLQYLEGEYKMVLSEMQSLANATRKRKAEKEQNFVFNPLQQVKDYRQLVVDVERYESLKRRKLQLERGSPPKSAVQASNGVKIAPKGSLVIKGNKVPVWMPYSEYLILGTFSIKPLDQED